MSHNRGMTFVRVSLLCALALCAACGSPRRQTVATTPISTPATATVAVAPGPGAQCQSQLEVGRVQTRPGCQIDERVSQQTTVLTHPCGGDGPASATFADAVFQGNVNAGELDVSIETFFDFSDGCRWRTKQRLQGTLASGQLAYSYEEQPTAGQRGCAQGCFASATARVY